MVNIGGSRTVDFVAVLCAWYKDVVNGSVGVVLNTCVVVVLWV